MIGWNVKIFTFSSLLFVIGILTFLFLRNTITTTQFIGVSTIWIVTIILFSASNKLESLTAFFAALALLLSIVNFSLQQTPTLILETLQVREAEKTLYLYIKNVGTIGAWQIKGAYALTAAHITGEPGSGITEGEQLLAFDKFDVRGEAFYPGEDNVSVIVLPLKMSENLSTVGKHIFFSIKIEYPRLQIWNIPMPFKKGYQGVFSLNEDKKSWVTNSKTLLPKYFNSIFLALTKYEAPVRQA